ncbi:MAG: prepilin-type N-terminal cleavage/methylation domain-containing protein [Desulfobacterales bacterium]|jgi:prepilin-type N-terminal cleavage/methylation domain-containing protein|nr:prepilin-type N-terminal cleavage/methylation domain-containing protein [Desulfobacterales bacterium]
MAEKRNIIERTMGNAGGFTLIETMIAIFILAVGILGLLSINLSTTKINFAARRMTTAAVENADRQEKLLALAYNDAVLMPGTTTTLVNGNYTVTWNVSAAGAPIPNVKTVTITTTWTENGENRSVAHVYYKADSF